MSDNAHRLTGDDIPCDCWSEDITEWFYRDGDTDWLFELKSEVPPGRELARAFVLRCAEEMKPQRISVDGLMHWVYSWHEITMMMHVYRGLAHTGELAPVNFLFGVLCDAIVKVDLEAANKEIDSSDGNLQ